MNKKKIIAFIGIIIISVITYKLLTRTKKDPGYIFDKKYNININDVNKTLNKVNFNKSNPKEFFADDVVNPHTLKFFKFLQKKFKEMNFKDHLEAIKEYLYSIMPENEAEKLFAIYKMFVEYELNMSKKLNAWGNPKNSEDALSMLRKMHEYRRKFFGKELADALFGADTKAKEYPLRRSKILHDGSLYAQDKEEKLKRLNEDMWGDEANAVENIPEPYTKYKEKLQLFSKDMSEMTDEDRSTKVREIRDSMFTPEVVERLEGVDKQIALEKVNEENYYSSEELIKNDPNLTDEEKTKKIYELQNEMFSSEAAAFRRRENIRKGRMRMK